MIAKFKYFPKRIHCNVTLYLPFVKIINDKDKSETTKAKTMQSNERNSETKSI